MSNLYLQTIDNNEWLKSQLTGTEYKNPNTDDTCFKPDDIMHNAFVFRGLRIDGYSLKDIAEMSNCSIEVVKKYVHDIPIDNVTPEMIHNFKIMRLNGNTLKEIAHYYNVSSTTVYNHTKDIYNHRRLNRIACMNTRSGKVKKFIVA